MAGTHNVVLSEDFREHYLVRNVYKGLQLLWRERATRLASLYLLFIVFLAALGPMLTPYPYDKTLYGPEGQLLRMAPPSFAHPLGTTASGQDVLSRIIYGARPTVITGLLGGTIIISIGMTVGVTAGYLGGRVEEALMRITDFVYSVPLIPFAIVVISFFSINLFTTVFIIGILLWRSSARVLRSQTLQIKERPFIRSAKAMGASPTRIIFKHILPNIAPMAALFFALGIGYAILLQAGLAFIGVSNPFVPSWGVMIRNAYRSGLMAQAMWWSIPPGLMISATVLSAFMLGRGVEDTSETDRYV